MLTANLDGERIFFLCRRAYVFLGSEEGFGGNLLHHHHPSRANVIDSDDAEQTEGGVVERSWKKTFRVRRLKNLSACLETLLASSHSSWSAGWSSGGGRQC